MGLPEYSPKVGLRPVADVAGTTELMEWDERQRSATKRTDIPGTGA
jgi:hypothetical protein